ncbi:hypothetical protein DRI50_04195 [candidate division KSB1 bacterium]|nr:MAG: hypothetical protein DRI50_04195 [candidate division KSB1 bacterium]
MFAWPQTACTINPLPFIQGAWKIIFSSVLHGFVWSRKQHREVAHWKAPLNFHKQKYVFQVIDLFLSCVTALKIIFK